MTTECLRVFGIVQGVGFRPTVARHASTCQIKGTVSNKGPYVEIYAQGSEEQVAHFKELLEKKPPQRSTILKITSQKVIAPIFEDFQIIQSEKTKGEIFISPDIATCETCRKELYDPSNRRYLHPFINCTSCGPRLTILEGLPYDRERTSMKEFPMCPACEKEYHDPVSRRYDAQPVCCNDCGPEVYLLDEDIKGHEAISRVRQLLHDGKIVAVKGIGGYHLAVDATNEEAVRRLRERKHRPFKPFAVMAKDMAVVERECMVENEMVRDLLTGHQKPIILMPKKAGHIANSVAPDNPKIGIMLPYAPLQMLLFDYDDGIKMPDVLVMTSANDSGAPITRDEEGARKELVGLCDAILSHNRKIRVRCDDSVVDIYQGEPYMIRRSRGYAPLPIMTTHPYQGHVIGIGGELKNTFCIGRDNLFYPSAYIGDLGDIRSVEALKESLKLMSSLLEVEPQIVCHDLHPRYNATMVAKEMGIRSVGIQHHYAHILSCMAENDWHDQVIGVSFDGTGYGLDGSIWGGEILVCDLDGFKREASIAPFLQIGGDLSAREGWRIAASMIYDLFEDGEDVIAKLALCDKQNAHVLKVMHDKQLNAIKSTSAGRLFDGVSAILNLTLTSSFEGEAATRLQYEAAQAQHVIKTKDWTSSQSNILLTNQLVKDIVERRLRHENVADLAYYFHQELAHMIVESVSRVHQKTGIETVALSGGVFQNTLLLELCEKGLKEKNLQVIRHHLIPPNDGGLCVGQALYASRLLEKEKR